MPLFKCIVCGKEFKAKKNKNKNRMCSRECFSIFKSSIKYRNEIVVKEHTAEIKIKSKKYGDFIAIIDLEDLDRVKKITWGVTKSLRGDCFYVRGKYQVEDKWKNISLHRYIIDCPKNMVVDHINRNTFDNRKENLCICTTQDNNNNRGVFRRNSNKLKGAYYHNGSKIWYSILILNKQRIWLGTFKNELEAHKAYIQAKKEHGIICKETIDNLELVC